jgi:hypothetical protein
MPCALTRRSQKLPTTFLPLKGHERDVHGKTCYVVRDPMSDTNMEQSTKPHHPPRHSRKPHDMISMISEGSYGGASCSLRAPSSLGDWR